MDIAVADRQKYAHIFMDDLQLTGRKSYRVTAVPQQHTESYAEEQQTFTVVNKEEAVQKNSK